MSNESDLCRRMHTERLTVHQNSCYVCCHIVIDTTDVFDNVGDRRKVDVWLKGSIPERQCVGVVDTLLEYFSGLSFEPLETCGLEVVPPVDKRHQCGDRLITVHIVTCSRELVAATPRWEGIFDSFFREGPIMFNHKVTDCFDSKLGISNLAILWNPNPYRTIGPFNCIYTTSTAMI